MKAMVLLARHEKLEKMGWKMILQIHDEIIFEGPEESMEEAMRIYNKEKLKGEAVKVYAFCNLIWMT